MRYYFKTFGCRVNQYETQGLRERLTSAPGARGVDDWAEADLAVINTCTVTEEADKDALRLLRKIARRNPAARLVVTGCLASRDPESILKAAPAAQVVGNDGKEHIPAMLGCSAAPSVVHGLHTRTRAFVKVQDGCNMHCAFCVIPEIRPRLSSRPLAEVEAEVRGLIGSGRSEIVLCGIRLGRYLTEDSDGRRVDLPGLLERLAELPGEFRLRLSSLEITDLTDRLIELTAASGGRICPSFHLPLQSGSNAVLKRMDRWYSAEFYARRVEALRARLPRAGLYGDVIAGFPGETSDEFGETAAFIRGMEFSGLHVFRYSRRRGTPAAVLKGQIPEAALKARAAALRELDGALRGNFALAAVGEERTVVRTPRRGTPEGLTEDFLTAILETDPGPGLHRVRIISRDGPNVRAVLPLAASLK